MVAEDDAGGFEAEFLSQFGGGVVAQLVRVPAVGPPPAAQLLFLLGRQSPPPFLDQLSLAPGQCVRRRAGVVAAAGDGPGVGVRGVRLAGTVPRASAAVRAGAIAAG